MEEAPAVEDAREAPHPQEAVVQHLLPDLAHLGDLGEEAVAADVEEEPSVLHGAGVAADLRFLLEDHAGDAGLHERVGAGEPRRAPADDHDAARFGHGRGKRRIMAGGSGLQSRMAEVAERHTHTA